jgi:hypothetical protein
MASVRSAPVKITVFDFTCAQTRQANRSACHSSASAAPGDHRSAASGQAAARLRHAVALLHQHARRGSSAVRVRPSVGQPARSRPPPRRFAFAARMAAPPRPRRRDHRLDERRHDRRAVSSSIGRFRPTMPPKAASASASRAPDVGLGRRRPVAAPHGLVCLMTAAAGSSNSRTMRAAASRSSRFVYDSSFPCSTCGAPRPTAPLGVPRRRLVRVLAVAEVADLARACSAGRRGEALAGVAHEARASTRSTGQRRRDGRVVRAVCANALRAEIQPEIRRRPVFGGRGLEHRLG